MQDQDLESLSKAELISIIRELMSGMAALKEELAKYKTPKDSRNSSKPPSSDYGSKPKPKKNRSLRKKGNKPLGGQPGHKGNTLHPVSDPDHIEEHSPSFCQGCGSDLTEVSGELEERRQVVDLPPIVPVYFEHQCFSKICSCGHKTVADFPEGVKSRIQYGGYITALVAYLSVRQYLPMNRMKELLSDIFNLGISEGGIERLISRFSQKSIPVYDHIKSLIMCSRVAGSDETGAKVAGGKWWFWTWQNKLLTYIVSSPSRGYKTIIEHFPDGLKYLVLVSDCLSAQLKTPAKIHQLCLAHLLRDLNFVIDLGKSAAWAKKVKKLFLEAMTFKKQLSEEHYPLEGANLNAVVEFERRLDRLLNSKRPSNHKEAIRFQKRLIKRKEYIFPFLHYHFVPPDNNGSERAIRNIKVKMKVSGQFRSEKGAQSFAIIRSVIDTCIKRGKNVMESMTLIAKTG